MTLTCIGLRASQVPVEKNLPANAGDARDTGSNPELRRSPAGGNPFSIPPWVIPWTEEPGGL